MDQEKEEELDLLEEKISSIRELSRYIDYFSEDYKGGERLDFKTSQEESKQAKENDVMQNNLTKKQNIFFNIWNQIKNALFFVKRYFL